MCTLSFIQIPSGIRLIHSRDEQRTRAPGQPPSVWTKGEHKLLSPRDPDAGGTWVALRDDGAILAVMNRNPEPPPTLDRNILKSRGLLIGQLATHPAEALESALREIQAANYAPFRAFAAIPPRDGKPALLVAAEWEAQSASPTSHPKVTTHQFPACWASSGLGDSVVADRLPLFDNTVKPDPTAEAQAAFHNHSWPNRGEASVFMNRPDAHTVSITTVEAFSPPDKNNLAGIMTHTNISPGPTPKDPMQPGKPQITVLEHRKLAARD